MPPSHRAFVFRWSQFAAELKPQIEAKALDARAIAEQLKRYYDEREDLGLGLTWQRYQDTRAVLGRPIAGFEPDRSYFQSEAEVLASLERVTPMVPIEGDRLLLLLRAAAERGLGLYVTV